MQRRPLIAWLGDEPPSELTRALGRSATIRAGWEPGARVAAMWSHADPSVLGVLPAGADRPAVLVACHDAPSPELRRRWEGEGADQVVPVTALAATLLEWLDGARAVVRGDDPPTFNPQRVRNTVDDAESSLAVLTGPVVVDAADPFPPLRLGADPVVERDDVRRYVTALDRYLARRDEVVRMLGEDGLTRFLELTHLREQVPASLGGRTRLDPYGRGRALEVPDWRILVRRMKPRTREIEVSEGRLYAIGTDGVVLVTLFAAAPRQRLLVDLPLDPDTNVQFIYEARWQRRVAARRWHVGALLVEMRRRRLDER
ncbi:MAG: hypothetical protein D6798_11405 [Deltaproteobacteria bacterium]|nr:MAG: hypothetical protein D6798_11405 [Deltaproteobacteria bacterium]